MASHTPVVKVFAAIQSPDYDCPWQTGGTSHSVGSGVVLEGGRVLTGAHVVADATFVQVQNTRDPRRYVAAVRAVAHDCDLALLEVEDPRFFDGLTPIELGGLPRLRETVTVVGFPVGGEQVSYTQGVVSRVELQPYTHSRTRLLAITVDAAINPGNSGGPAIDAGGRLVGIAFQKLTNAENIGHLVPMVLVRRFLAAVERGLPLEAPALGVRFQTLENPSLRAALGLGPDQAGVRVVDVGHGGAADGRLRRDDVVVEVEGVPVADNGTVPYGDGLRTHIAVLLSDRQVGDPLKVRFVRQGKLRAATLRLSTDASLVPRCTYDPEPTWFAFGGLVFQRLTLHYLRTWSKLHNAPRDMVSLYRRAMREKGRREAVVLTSVLAHPLTTGLDGLEDEVVVGVDGRMPVDTRDLLASLDGADHPVRLELASGALAVVDPVAARAASDEILARYRIPANRSADLR